MKIGFHLLNKDLIWELIWHMKYLAKVCSFPWLVSHGHILTWGNLAKCGFIGSPYFSFCAEEDESINHLLDSWTFTLLIWDDLAMVM